MLIKFYKCENDMRCLNKTFTLLFTKEITIKHSLDIVNPFITFSDKEILKSNYIYIQELDRYYYLNNQDYMLNNLFTNYYHLDLLQTYKSQLLPMKCLVTNTQSELEDDKYNSNFNTNIDVRMSTVKYDFENNFNENGNNILIALLGNRGV